MPAAFVLLVALQTAAPEPAWLIEARRCVAETRQGLARGFTGESWNELVDREAALAATVPPTARELAPRLESSDDADRAAALAAMAAHSINSEQLLQMVIRRYSRTDSLVVRSYGARALRAMTAEQVSVNLSQLVRLVRQEDAITLLPILAPVLGPPAMVELLADVAAAGSPVVAFLTARDLGEDRVRGLKGLLERRGAVCALHAIQNVEFMMSQKGWPVESLEPLKGCATP